MTRAAAEADFIGTVPSVEMNSITLTTVLLKALSLCSHALYIFVECVHFLIQPRVLRFRRVAAAQLFERLLNGEFSSFSHDSAP